MLFSLLYMLLRAVFRVAPPGDQRDREIEILVLRHQVKVLKRKTGRPRSVHIGTSRTIRQWGLEKIDSSEALLHADLLGLGPFNPL